MYFCIMKENFKDNWKWQLDLLRFKYNWPDSRDVRFHNFLIFWGSTITHSLALNCFCFSLHLFQCIHRLRHWPPNSITGWLSALTDRAGCEIRHAQLLPAGPICQHLCQISLSPWRGDWSWHGAQRPTRQQLAVPAAKRGAHCCHPPAALVCHPCQQPTGLCRLGIRRRRFRR